MKIDKELNLIIPIERGTRTIAIEGQEPSEVPNIEGYICSIPISLAAFEVHSDLIARTYTRLFTGGYGVVAGPRTAAIIMRQTAKEAGDPEKATLLQNDFRRMSTFASMTKDGWTQIPLEEALAKKMMTEREASEVDNALAFFTVTSAMSRQSEMRPLLLGMTSFWGTFPISSTFTEFLASLPTLTEIAPSTKKEASLVPR